MAIWKQILETLQAKLTNISKAEKNSLDMSVILTNLSEITPLDTTYNSIDVEGQKVALEGQTLSEIGLATLLTKAQESKIFPEFPWIMSAQPTKKAKPLIFGWNYR